MRIKWIKSSTLRLLKMSEHEAAVLKFLDAQQRPVLREEIIANVKEASDTLISEAINRLLQTQKINTFCVPLDNLQKELYFFWINRKKSNISVEQDRQKVAADSVSDSIAMLKKQIAELDKEIEELEKAGAREKPPADLIEKLHDYNDMKDAGQALLGCLAQLEGTTTKQMYRKFGLNMDD